MTSRESLELRVENHALAADSLPPQRHSDLFALDELIEVHERSVGSTTGYPQSPYQVLRMLPRDATPAQQDSAIQAWLKPSIIRYSDQPDTLHLPGHSPAQDLMEVNLPQYYRKNFFSNDTLFYTEKPGSLPGVAGDPIPYTIHGDSAITMLLMLCFVILVVSLARLRLFIVRQLKNFFFPSYNDNSNNETSGELRLQFFLMVLSCLLLALGTYQYVTYFVADTFLLSSEFMLIVILFGVFMGYYLLKGLLYAFVDYVFFDSAQNMKWLKTVLFINASQSVLLFPAVLLIIYFNYSLESALYYFILVLIFLKILTFYKCWSIFFRQNSFYLQTFSYFCALEIVPMLSLISGLAVLIDNLKLNI